MKFGRDKTAKPPATTVELPERSDTVTLVPLSGARIPARVMESEEGMLQVAIMVPIEPLSAAQLQALVIEFQGPNGRVHLTGTASTDPSDPDVLHIEQPRSIDVVQEREYVRIKSARPALVFGGPELIQINGCTVDISGGGFLLAGADALKIGDQVHFQLELAAGELPVSGTGKIVRIDAHGYRGVIFDEIKELDRRRLIRFIFECQRAELRMGLEVERHGD
ncbi:MAG TPA: PilZ domain-containing protein [Solirubrobacteraceae bacterium]|nr:PilZ domain-containing protein [Solirubrobacteraceae bacterium]